MNHLDAALDGVTRLGLDTAPIIYYIEANPRYDPFISLAFQRIADGRVAGVTSVITLTEVLVHPLRAGATELAQRYRDLLLHSPNFKVVPIEASIAEQAALLRDQYNLRTPDALQVAVAMSAGCEAFLCNDAAFKRIPDLRMLTLEKLIGDQ